MHNETNKGSQKALFRSPHPEYRWTDLDCKWLPTVTSIIQEQTCQSSTNTILNICTIVFTICGSKFELARDFMNAGSQIIIVSRFFPNLPYWPSYPCVAPSSNSQEISWMLGHKYSLNWVFTRFFPKCVLLTQFLSLHDPDSETLTSIL